MKSPLARLAVVVTSIGTVSISSPSWGQDSPEEPGRSAEVRQALSVVEQYIASEAAGATERIDSRAEMLEFKFKTTGENGRYRLLGEDAWRDWERDRDGGREVRGLAVIGEPQVETLGNNLFRIHCAIHLDVLEDGKPWEGVSLRSFEVRMDEAGEPRIRQEAELANREGINPGKSKRVKKSETSVRSNLRSSPTSTRDNVIGKVESGEAIQVWDQEEEQWLLVRKDDGTVGFLHRGQIDFSDPEPGNPEADGSGSSASASGGAKTYPFATTLPGKPGYVLNPYTNTIVDVQGLRPGTLVRDPLDPVENRGFRVPLDGSPVRAVIVEDE